MKKNKTFEWIKNKFRKFYPSFKYKSVESIPYSFIEKNHIKLIMLDMDNTIVDYHRENYTPEMKEWAQRMQRSGIKLYILSNSPFEKTVKQIASELGMKYYHNATKPSLRGFKKIQETEKVPKENILMIGDQIFTDIFGGNRFGVKTILVDPINKKESLHTKIKRPFEKVILKRYFRKKR